MFISLSYLETISDIHLNLIPVIQHSHLATCRVNGCSQTFKTYSAMKSHLSRNHPNAPDPSPATDSGLARTLQRIDSTGHEGDVESGGNCSTEVGKDTTIHEYEDESHEQLLHSGDENPKSKTHAALLLLTLKEKHRLTQTSVDFAVQQMEDMMEYTIKDMKSSVEKIVSEYCNTIGVDIPDLTQGFPSTSPFSGLESEYLQTKFYKENFKLIVSV